MNPEEFLKYLADHKGEAYVGNPETLQVAKQMEKAKLLDEVGQPDGEYQLMRYVGVSAIA